LLIDPGKVREKTVELVRRARNLGIGEAILLGHNTSRMQPIPGLRRVAFVLEAEIVEVRTKPSKPIGLIGADAFGKVPVFEDPERPVLGGIVRFTLDYGATLALTTSDYVGKVYA
jgi:predicted amino acid racemase